jgi:hypothetical protein
MSLNLTHVDTPGLYYKTGKSSRIYNLFRDSHQTERLYYTELPGLTPQANREWLKQKCRQALCRHESMEWILDPKLPAQPSLVVQQDIKDISIRAIGWPIENRRRPEAVVEHHLLDEVAAGIESESQD